MKKILVLMVALMALTTTATAQVQKREYSFSRLYHETVETSNGNFDRVNPYVCERVNGGDWNKISDDRVVICQEVKMHDRKSHELVLTAENYTKKSLNLKVKFSYTIKGGSKQTKTMDMYVYPQGKSYSNVIYMFWKNNPFVESFHIESIKIEKMW
ncbi:MAG: hypothetical protein IJP46_09690 [Prevotella sp.]|nr:hypothetical protein [Prevotella sp.]